VQHVPIIVDSSAVVVHRYVLQDVVQLVISHVLIDVRMRVTIIVICPALKHVVDVQISATHVLECVLECVL
jgi:hypothetical protein